ncbi:ATP-binding protein [Methylobacterium organophilum]|uniref:histidine kinase n=1 Tax=Methylobacterium organophilum TaxID=410 RepID=A0ABQ4T8W8_METOR|nr:ATP-binding protein [Methylobacterium organophilum]GJE27032.1 Adaptive-response sensory-kinase SasA [Methylobacterium organophilum]
MFERASERIRRWLDAVGHLQLLAILAFLGPALVLAVVTLQSRTLLLQSAADRAGRLADLLAQHATTTFDTYNLTFNRVEDYLRDAPRPLEEAPLHRLLSQLDGEVRSTDALVYYDPSWNTAAHSRFMPTARTYVGDRDYIRMVEAQSAGGETLLSGKQGLVVSRPFRSRITGAVILVAARGLHDASGRLQGGLGVVLSQSVYQDFYRTAALSKSDRVALIRADGRVLAQIPPAPAAPEPSYAAAPAVNGLAASFERPLPLIDGTADTVSDADGIRRIAGLRRVEGYPAYVEVGLAVEGLLAHWRRGVAVNAVIAALTSLALFALARLALAKTRAEAEAQRLLLAEAEERAKAEAALRQAQKMEALGQLTGGIAHDFNTVLNVVLVNLENARRWLDDGRAKEPGRLDGYVLAATQGAERGVALTRRLLGFAHPQAMEAGPVMVSRLVFGVLELLGQAAGSGVRITLDCPRSLPPALADANALETALLNLVVNARDAMPNGGRVHIAARAETVKPGALAAIRPGRYVVVGVEDTGRGMDAEAVARATEPFFTTKPPGMGSGLGLAMVDRFARQSGGLLGLTSRPGHGTLVEIWLPAAEVPAPQPVVTS